MGSRASLQMEPGRSSREPPLDYQRWTTIGLSLGSLSPCQGTQGPGLLRFAPSLRKQAALDGRFLFVAIIFPVQAAADGLYESQ